MNGHNKGILFLHFLHFPLKKRKLTKGIKSNHFSLYPQETQWDGVLIISSSSSDLRITTPKKLPTINPTPNKKKYIKFIKKLEAIKHI